MISMANKYKNMFPSLAHIINQSINQSINQPNLAFAKCRLDEVIRGASYE